MKTLSLCLYQSPLAACLLTHNQPPATALRSVVVAPVASLLQQQQHALQRRCGGVIRGCRDSLPDRVAPPPPRPLAASLPPTHMTLRLTHTACAPLCGLATSSMRAAVGIRCPCLGQCLQAVALLMLMLLAAGPPRGAALTDIELEWGRDKRYNPSLVEHQNVYISALKFTSFKRAKGKTIWVNKLFMCVGGSSDIQKMRCTAFNPWPGEYLECEFDKRVRNGKLDTSGLGDVKVWRWPGGRSRVCVRGRTYTPPPPGAAPRRQLPVPVPANRPDTCRQSGWSSCGKHTHACPPLAEGNNPCTATTGLIACMISVHCTVHVRCHPYVRVTLQCAHGFRRVARQGTAHMPYLGASLSAQWTARCAPTRWCITSG